MPPAGEHADQAEARAGLPGAAAGLADVAAGDPDVAVSGWVAQEGGELVALERLAGCAVGVDDADLVEALGEIVAQALQLAEAEQARAGEAGVAIDHSMASSGLVAAAASASSRSSLAIWARRVRRAAASSGRVCGACRSVLG